MALKDCVAWNPTTDMEPVYAEDLRALFGTPGATRITARGGREWALIPWSTDGKLGWFEVVPDAQPRRPTFDTEPAVKP
jgi:hypothetical protein